jgi:hypothetical protein
MIIIIIIIYCGGKKECKYTSSPHSPYVLSKHAQRQLFNFYSFMLPELWSCKGLWELLICYVTITLATVHYLRSNINISTSKWLTGIIVAQFISFISECNDNGWNWTQNTVNRKQYLKNKNNKYIFRYAKDKCAMVDSSKNSSSSFHFIYFTFDWSYTDVELVMYTFSIINKTSVHSA